MQYIEHSEFDNKTISQDIARTGAFKEITSLRDDQIGLLQKRIERIQLKGLASNQIVPASYTVPLLNYASEHPEIEYELKYMLALSLINARKVIQACEILRIIQAKLLLNIADSHGLRRKAVCIEILIADCMNPHFQLQEKLKALKRAVSLVLNEDLEPTSLSAPSNYSAEDIYTFLLHKHPHLVKVLISLLSDAHEAVRIAAIRTLEFLIENMGCSLGPYVVAILKEIVSTFPSNTIMNSNDFISATNAAEVLPKNSEQSSNVIPVISSQLEKLISYYNRLLETYNSILYSASKQSLHKVFTEIILNMTYNAGTTVEMRSVLIEIGERILKSNRGDFALTPSFLNGIINDRYSGNSRLATIAQSMWQTIKERLYLNCDRKQRKKLIQWIIENLVSVGEKMNGYSEIKEYTEEDIIIKLKVYLEVAESLLITKKEKQNSLEIDIHKIFFKANRSDCYELINPLLYWLNFAMSSEERTDLFNKLWLCVSLILKDMSEYIGLDPSSLIEPIIEKAKTYCKHSSPPISTLKILSAIFNDFKQFNTSANKVLVELTDLLASKMPNYPHEDIFTTFDLLFDITFPFLDEEVIEGIISNMINRYTSKCKRQQESLKKLIQKGLMHSVQLNKKSANIETTFFGTVMKFCISKNKVVLHIDMDHNKKMNLHDNFMNKLNFFIEAISLLNEYHVELYKYLILFKELNGFLLLLLENGHSNIRLKTFEILRVLYDYYINYLKDANPNIITKEQFVIAKLAFEAANSLQLNASDSYMQLNFLITLNVIFKHILPVPSFDLELVKRKQHALPALTGVIDLESINLKNIQNVAIADSKYLHGRLMAGFKVWAHITSATNSFWSNIRYASYSFLCSFLCIDINDYKSTFREKLSSDFLPLLTMLLSSKETEARIGGLNILGVFMGFCYDISNHKIEAELNFFRRNSSFISSAIWQQVFDLQNDLESTIREAASVLIQLSAPKASVMNFWQMNAELERLQLNCLVGKYRDLSSLGKLLCSNAVEAFALLDTTEKATDFQTNKIPHVFPDNVLQPDSFSSGNSKDLENQMFILEKCSSVQIKAAISIFNNDRRLSKNLWVEDKFSQDNQELSIAKRVEEEADEEAFKVVDILEDKLMVSLDRNKIAYEEIKEDEYKRAAKEDNAKKDSLDAEPYRFLSSNEEINQDDLEIIEIPEGDEDFLEKLESDKVPVIKNTYANKKNKRPAAPRPRGKIAQNKSENSPAITSKEVANAKSIEKYKELKPEAKSIAERPIERNYTTSKIKLPSSPLKITNILESINITGNKASRQTPQTKNSIVLGLHASKDLPEHKSNESVDGNTRATSQPIIGSRSCFKNYQEIPFSKKLYPQSTREKPELSTPSKQRKSIKASTHCNSLSATLRTKIFVHPEQFLENLKFRSKKDKSHGKKQLKKNLTKTSPALAAILKSLRPAAYKAMSNPAVKTRKTKGRSKKQKRQMKLKGKKSPKKIGLNVPIQTINIRTDQLNFKAEYKSKTPMIDNFTKI